MDSESQAWNKVIPLQLSQATGWNGSKRPLLVLMLVLYMCQLIGTGSPMNLLTFSKILVVKQ